LNQLRIIFLRNEISHVKDSVPLDQMSAFHQANSSFSFLNETKVHFMNNNASTLVYY